MKFLLDSIDKSPIMLITVWPYKFILEIELGTKFIAKEKVLLMILIDAVSYLLKSILIPSQNSLQKSSIHAKHNAVIFLCKFLCKNA